MIGLRRRFALAPGDDGVIAIVVAIFAVVMFAFAALVVDLGYARDHKVSYQAAADAAALAAGQYLLDQPAATPDEVAAVVRRFLSTNAPDLSMPGFTCTDRTGGPRTALTGDTTSWCAYDKGRELVQVRIAPQQMPSFFAGAFGGGHAVVAGFAQASWAGRLRDLECTVCVLQDASVSDGSMTVGGGDLAVSGDLSLDDGGRVQVLDPGELRVGGTAPTGSHVDPQAIAVDPFPDPLGDLTLPPVGYTDPAGPGRGACTPGNFTTITGCDTLAPGVYVITGDNEVSDEVLSASGVLLFFTCADGAVPRPCTAADPRGAGGSLTVDDNGSLRLLGGLPSGDPDFADRSFSIIYDRNNTAPLTLDGDEHRVVITDDVYLPSAVLRTVGAVDLADVVARTVSAGEGSLRAGTTNPVTSTVTEPAPPSLTK